MVKHGALLLNQLVVDGALADHHKQAVMRSAETLNLADAEFFLLSEGMVTKEQLLAALSRVYEVPFFDVRGYLFNHDLVTLFDIDFLLHWMLIPIELEEGVIAMVAGDPAKEGLLEAMDDYTDYTVALRVGIIRDIIDEIRAFSDLPPQDETLIEENSDFDEDTADIVDAESL
ncbi:hypothetical protein M1466_01720 [Candidatus Dependentiae bacterium]|nr:hypothetical protein [Candidatus Dependentiae bacterium]